VGVAFVGLEDGIIVRCNPAYASILGSTPGGIEGHSFFEFLDEAQEAKARKERERRLRGEASEYEVVVTAEGGEVRHLLATGVPLYDERDGSYLGAAQTLVDVTERRQAEEAVRESERLQRFAFEEAPVGMALLEPYDGRWLAANPKLCRILRYSLSQLLSGMTWQDVAHPDDLGADLEFAERVLAGEIFSYSLEKRYLRRCGSVVWANVTVSLRRSASGEPDCFFLMLEDITDRKLKELVPEPLTHRELKVLKLIAQGQPNYEIARNLNYSLGTVKDDVQAILAKLAAKKRRRAVVEAIRVGLIPPPR
jgi:PAS domain S-box-containing protein